MRLLKLLSPRTIPNNKQQWNWQIHLYVWILQQLQRCYKRGALSDTIRLGNTQLIHNRRDYWYEQELKKYHLYNESDLQPTSPPVTNKLEHIRSFLFHWEDTSILLQNGKYYSIKRNNGTLSIDSNFEGVLIVHLHNKTVIKTEIKLTE